MSQEKKEENQLKNKEKEDSEPNEPDFLRNIYKKRGEKKRREEKKKKGTPARASRIIEKI